MLNNTHINSALSAAKHPILLESEAQLIAAAREWQDCGSLGIDTEFVRERTYRADLGLVQISNGSSAWLADPIALGSLEPLTELMLRKETTKVLHSSTEDLEVLLYVLGELPEPLVDTQIACAMLGQSLQLGYHHAVKWLFDIEIDKDQTRSNWCRRPLNNKQLLYAAMDVVLLPQMLQELRRRLEDCGRWEWLEEDVARLKRNSRQQVEPETAYMRFAGFGRLDDASLRVLQALAEWRENIAKNRNRARGFVISDTGMMNLVQLKPANASEIRAIEDIHPGVLNRYQDQLLELIVRARDGDFPVERIEQFGNAQKKQINSMRRVVNNRAAELGVEPALLASRRELERLVRAVMQDQPLPERFLGWRKQVITNDLLEQLGVAS
ncbi:ribonuclease D [Pseudomonadota bacterium]